jgi:hypothetical protein
MFVSTRITHLALSRSYRVKARGADSHGMDRTYLFLRGQVSAHRLDAIATLDNIRLEGDRPGATVELEE